MGRRRKGNKVTGWVNFFKPEGMTSTQAVGKVRRYLNAQKAGHAGTLDPLATGILPIALGEATKTIPYCQDHLKTYSFTIQWGESRDTDDAEGEVIETSDHRPTLSDIEKILPQYTGNIEQTPPQFSAIKIDGIRAYDRARSGKTSKLVPRPVYVEKLELLEAHKDYVRLKCFCGKGTYIRSLGRDMAQELNTVGYITNLKRIRVGPFTLDNAIFLEKLEEIEHSAALDKVLLPIETVLDDIPALALNEREAANLRNGQKLSFIARRDMDRLHHAGLDLERKMSALATYQGRPVALISVDGVEIRPQRVLNL